jgi:hypothetical protein
LYDVALELMDAAAEVAIQSIEFAAQSPPLSLQDCRAI